MNIYFLSYCLKHTAHSLKDTLRRLHPFALPYKSHMQLESPSRNCLGKLLVVQAVSLPHLSLGTVAIHGMTQALLGHRHHNLYGRLRRWESRMQRRTNLPHRT